MKDLISNIHFQLGALHKCSYAEFHLQPCTDLMGRSARRLHTQQHWSFLGHVLKAVPICLHTVIYKPLISSSQSEGIWLAKAGFAFDVKSCPVSDVALT